MKWVYLKSETFSVSQLLNNNKTAMESFLDGDVLGNLGLWHLF